MGPYTEWVLALGVTGGALMLACSGLAFISCAWFDSARMMRMAMSLLVYGAVTMAAVAVPVSIRVFSGDWRSWLPGFIEYYLALVLGEEVFVFALCMLGLLVGLGLLRHLIALFVGYRAVDLAVKRTISAALIAIKGKLCRASRVMRRIAGSVRRASDGR